MIQFLRKSSDLGQFLDCSFLLINQMLSLRIVSNIFYTYHKKINFVRADSNTFAFTICKIQVTGVCRSKCRLSNSKYQAFLK